MSIPSSEADQVLNGTINSDSLCGGDGNDTLIGNAGTDTLDGSNGIDTVSFLDSTQGVIVDLNPTGSIPAKAVVTFEEATSSLVGFSGADNASIITNETGNHFGQVIKAGDTTSWAGTTISTGANQTIENILFTADATVMTLRVWAPAAGLQIRLKVEDSNDNTHSVETESTTTLANGWQTLTFDFAHPVFGTAALNTATNYNRATVFFNFGKTGAQDGGGTYYIDDLSFDCNQVGHIC